MQTLIERENGIPFVAPSVKERAIDDTAVALRFVEQLESGNFDLVVCMTGVGLAFLRDVCSASMPVERFAAALRRATIVSRGPKPVGVLRALDVPIAVIVPEPNTWREVVAAVASRPERKIAVQEHGRPNPSLTAALEELGAQVTPVAIYRWDLPDDLQPLRDAVSRICSGNCDVILFTSSVQLDHLLTIARTMNAEDQVRSALAEKIVIASVGPVMSEALIAEGIPPDITPRTPKMWALVKAAADESAACLARKKNGRPGLG
jgi:uroporphyrinogen-III synthase